MMANSEMPEEFLSDEEDEEHQGATPEGRQRKQERHAESMVRSMERASSPFSGDRDFLPLIGTTTMPDGKFTLETILQLHMGVLGAAMLVPAGCAPARPPSATLCQGHTMKCLLPWRPRSNGSTVSWPWA